MSEFSSKDLSHLKNLCRIDCTEQEEADILSSLRQILRYMEQLSEVDTEKTPPCNYVLRSMANHHLREDKVGKLLPREQFLANAPEQIGGMIRTPPILKDL